MKIRHEAYQYYFYFIQERMNIFWKRYNGQTSGFTKDPILAKHKFTNVYRAQDRVSQFLIDSVIYKGTGYNEEDTLLRILVFKVFNNIDTWLFLEQHLGEIKVSNFDVNKISSLLAERISHRPIFSAAYMMTGSHSKYVAYKSKHEKWLMMIKHEMLDDKALQKIVKATSLQQVYSILESCFYERSFLAYQYAIDFNYSEVIDFNENSFVKAGIGSIRGIKKCFIDADRYTYEDCIRYTQNNFLKHQEQYGFTSFRNLFGRLPTLIDLQNCFCETDKYLRVKMPELQVDNIRIKQKFTNPKENLNYFFPPKWNINKFIKPCITKNSAGLTLF